MTAGGALLQLDVDIMLFRTWFPPIEPCRLLVLYKAALLGSCDSMVEAVRNGRKASVQLKLIRLAALVVETSVIKGKGAALCWGLYSHTKRRAESKRR